MNFADLKVLDATCTCVTVHQINLSFMLMLLIFASYLGHKLDFQSTGYNVAVTLSSIFVTSV